MEIKYRLLIVDDEQLERQAIKFIVDRRCPNIEIIGEADEGELACQLASKYLPDIILMDIRMPAMNGLEAVKHIRQHLPNVKVIFLTINVAIKLSQIVKA
ncbi:Transcriptional regulatory protein DegU [Sporomusa carbonis]|uniref:response regulator n=1 Tax=Sporomusa carbonis TaxID=3076075 RepID=UPI003A65A7BE